MAVSVQQAEIESLYIGYFNRSSEPAELAYWVGRLNDGMSLVAIAQSFSAQPEATMDLREPGEGRSRLQLGRLQGG